VENKSRSQHLHATLLAFSPDGQSIACFDEQNWKIAIMDFESGTTRKLFDLPQDSITSGRARWTVDGRGVTYLRKDNIWFTLTIGPKMGTKWQYRAAQ
jgi:hypothetical protein